MKMAWGAVLVFAFVSLAHAEDRFQKYAAVVSTERCAALDFSSYFIAQNAKANLLSINPNLSQPNFGGKYLLLRNEMMAETLYLIADCTTGKFLKEKLEAPFKGEVEFKPDSLLVIMHDKDKDEFQIWRDGDWNQVEDPLPPAAPSAAAQPNPLTESKAAVPAPVRTSHDAEFARFPVNETISSCKPLKYDSYFRAQQVKDSILDDNAALDRPNFAGKYLLVKARLLFEVIYLVADCETGEFFPVVLKGQVHFTPKSSFVWVSSSSAFPETYLWEAPEWVQIHDPLRRSPPPIHHRLNRAQSAALIGFIKRDRKDTIIRDDELKCETECKNAMPWLKRRGNYFTNLKCDTHKVSCELDAEVKAQP